MRRWMFLALIALLTVPFASAEGMKSKEKSKSAMADCEAMMEQHEAMQKQMAGMDAKLQSLVDDMNRADASAKVDKMAAVITELVSQRSMMQKQMSEMQPEMMHHMMEHMQGGKEGMAECPMMKQGQKHEH
jgi:uncharacterized protein YhaN